VTEQVNHDAAEVATHDTAVEAEIEENKKAATKAIGNDTSEKEISKVNDELCPDEVYEKNKTVCTVNFYPEDTGNKLFGERLVNFFHDSRFWIVNRTFLETITK
jgi:hypothetical protein